MNNFSTVVMASGHLCLTLSESVGWDEFADYGEAVARELGARVVDRADGFDIRVWKLELATASLRLTYDDFPHAVSLESDDEAGDRLLRELESRLRVDERLSDALRG